MISKLGVGILTVAALLIAAPSNAFAAAKPKPDKKKIQKYFNDLKKLPVGSPVAKVSSLIKTLDGLDPVNAGKYMKTGLDKLYTTKTNKTAVNTLNKQLTGIIKSAGKKFRLKPAQITKAINDTAKQNKIFQAKKTSPVAMLSLIGVPALA